MVEIKKIFINFQFNNISLKALEIAKDLANKYNSQLIIFHEIEDVYMMKKIAASFGLPVPPDLEEKNKTSAKSRIEDLLTDFSKDVKIIVDISESVKNSLPKFIKEESPDLVIITEDYEYLAKKIESNVFIVKK
jgi:nucleotide-binding universal stress UspA family protein